MSLGYCEGCLICTSWVTGSLEVLQRIFKRLDQDALFNFSQVQTWARDAVVWYLEPHLRNQELVYGPQKQHEVFSIAVAAFPPAQFGVDLNLDVVRDTDPLTPTKVRPENWEALSAQKMRTNEYLMTLCNKILTAQNVCKYVEDTAKRLRSWSIAHRPYVDFASLQLERTPTKAPSRSLTSMMMLWCCLRTVNKSIEGQRLDQPNRPLTSDWLKEEVEAFVRKVVLDNDEEALITVYRGFHFMDPLIEVVKQHPRTLHHQHLFNETDEAAWACSLLYQGLDRFLEVMSGEDSVIDKALNGELTGIDGVTEVKGDIWTTFIRDVVNSDMFDSIKGKPEAHIRAPNRHF